jgi:hypothetical protein
MLKCCHWWKEDLQSQLLRGIGPSSPTGTDDERQKGGPLVPIERTETKGRLLSRVVIPPETKGCPSRNPLRTPLVSGGITTRD